ncbi:MAG: hypothetical protein K8R21_09005 [Leptospira sp.]|nr:hypothetical protein [Leptospira sp.]
MANNVKYSLKGFFTLSGKFYPDIIFTFILVLVYGGVCFYNPSLLPALGISVTGFLCTIAFLKKKNMYVYFPGLIYQFLLFLIITPPVFFDLRILIPVVFLGTLLYYITPIAPMLRFPLGLYLSALLVSITFALNETGILPFHISGENLFFPVPIMNSTEFMGMFFLQNLPDRGIGNFNFSILENLGVYIILFLPLGFLRSERFRYDLLFFGLLFFSFAMLFYPDIFPFMDRILFYTCIWYLIYSSPGRSAGSVFYISLGAGILTCGLPALCIFYPLMPLPPVSLLIVFFLVHAILSLFVIEKNFHGKRLDKTGIK